ncbi:beta-ketoacyl-[acyl-carrier-protein] synthase family protein [Streptomyces nanshensis]|uniref:beta-ketoacyl-[acyl-carrier-protein] synthase family protein n=1 Tax=Streptomyces nanshensis TaxID=518642 RepID=UPI0030B85A50
MVTGMGATTPLGGSVAQTWGAIRSGESGVTKLETDGPPLPVRLAGLLREDPTVPLARCLYPEPHEQARMARRLPALLDRSQQVALLAAHEALTDADLLTSSLPSRVTEVDPERLAVALGSGVGGANSLIQAHDTLHERGWTRVPPWAVTRLMPGGPAAAVSIEFGAQAGVHAPSSACASGAEALWLGRMLIQTGRADVVIAGGADASISPVSIAGFAVIRSLSRCDDPERAARPFDRDRDGFVMGEGAGVLVLERQEHAQARGAKIHAHLVGAEVSADANDWKLPDTERQVRTLQAAIADAELTPYDIDHVSAHATGTLAGDAAEARAISRALGPACPTVTAIKGHTSHMIGAAGAVEAIVAIRTIQTGVVPAVRNLEQLDADIEDLDVVRSAHREQRGIRAALSSSFGFGGVNAVLVLTA